MMDLDAFLAAKTEELKNYRKVKVSGHETMKYVNMVMDCRLGMMNDLSLALEKHDPGKAREIAKRWMSRFNELEEKVIFGDPV
jgi:hypothetical protein